MAQHVTELVTKHDGLNLIPWTQGKEELPYKWSSEVHFQTTRSMHVCVCEPFDSVPNTHSAGYNHLYLEFQMSQCFLSSPWAPDVVW